MSKRLWTSSPRRARALLGGVLALCGVLGGCGPAEESDDGASGLAIRVLPDEETDDFSTQAAQLSLSASELRFGQRCPGAQEVKRLELRSTGSSPLTIRTLSLRGAAFRLVSPPALPATLPAGGRLVLTVRFRPPVERPDDLAPTGALVINSSDPGRPSVTVTLRGSVPPVQFSFSRSTLDFGTLHTGLPATLNLQLRNNGACAVTIGGFEVTGDLSDAVLIDDPGESLAAGQRRDVEVIGLCDQRGTLDASARFFSAFGQTLGTVRVRGVCRP